MRILVVEPDPSTAQTVHLMLSVEGMKPTPCETGDEAISLAKLFGYDLVTLEINLPDMSGYDVLRSLRIAKVDTPILILSGLADTHDKVRGLGYGADDYLTKPFHKDELVARIHAIVRRSKGHSSQSISVGDLTVNLDQKTVEVAGSYVRLTGKEYQMIELMALRRGACVTKESFLDHLYGGRDEPELKIVDVFMCKLRKKLAVTSNRRSYIETIWGRGYVLREAPMTPRVVNGRELHFGAAA